MTTARDAGPGAMPAQVSSRDYPALPALLVGAPCLALSAGLAWTYPLGGMVPTAVLALYAAALWRWSGLWLLVIPAVLPALDFAPWTGWTLVGEADAFVLVTVAVLAVRVRLRRRDLVPGGFAAVVLGVATLATAVGAIRGLACPLVVPGGSSNPLLRPDNGLRVAKGFAEALILLPFLRQHWRIQGDAPALFGLGMLAGLAAVALATMRERALFPGLFDFTMAYRVVGPFSSMHLGGGYLGAYLAMALPFPLAYAARDVRQAPPALVGPAMLAIGGLYALCVTFARAAYGAAGAATLVTTGAMARAGQRGKSPLRVLLSVGVAGLLLAVALGTPFMRGRIALARTDFAERWNEWAHGLALRDPGLATTLFGMGLGTYPRVAFLRGGPEHRPTNFVLGGAAGRGVLSLAAGANLYIGQKVPVRADRLYRAQVLLRAGDGAGLVVYLCEKMLLYSLHCDTAALRPRARERWETLTATLSSGGFFGAAGWLGRPVEFGLLAVPAGSRLEVRRVALRDGRGRDLLANGDFAQSMRRWFVTDDDHLAWRIHNEYLATLFEGGALGLLSFVLLIAAGLAGALRAARRGCRMAPAVAGALAAVICASLFDHVLEVPRLATLVDLIAVIGLVMIRRPAGPGPG